MPDVHPDSFMPLHSLSAMDLNPAVKAEYIHQIIFYTSFGVLQSYIKN